jgi:hypothetical protein
MLSNLYILHVLKIYTKFAMSKIILMLKVFKKEKSVLDFIELEKRIITNYQTV